MRQRVWLSYDLGIDGDYEDLYSWLDSKGAVECGDSCASFIYSFRKDLIHELLKELRAGVQLRPRDRVYLIYSENGKGGGKFIHGKRKRAPWAGYAIEPGEEAVDEG